MNSDVIYLSGDMFTVDTCRVETMVERLEAIPEVCADSLVIASGGPLLAACMDSILAKDSHTIFEECVVNLSREAAFTVVADMDKVACEPERFTPYLSPFLVVNAALFRSFIISGQISVVNDRFSHIIVLTYKK